MSDRKFYEYVLVVIALVVALFIGGIIKPTPDLRVHQDAPIAWSLLTGPYEYIAKESDAQFKTVYVGGAYEGLGHTQYGSLILICTRGEPISPVDGSPREAWCLAWTWNGADWEPYELYMLGTQNQYDEWKTKEAEK